MAPRAGSVVLIRPYLTAPTYRIRLPLHFSKKFFECFSASSVNVVTEPLLSGIPARRRSATLALRLSANIQLFARLGLRANEVVTLEVEDIDWRAASVYLQIVDPAAFAGAQASIAQMDFFVAQCHANDPIDPAKPVRLPGEQASLSIERSRRDGILLSPSTISTLRSWASRLGVDARILE